jgi:hypothetical protein
MFLTVMAYSPEASFYHWYVLSATAEFCFTWGFQPSPRSAVLESLYSFPDWEFLATTDTSASSTSVLDFLQQSSYRALDLWSSTLMSAGIPTGLTRLQLGPTYYADDALLHSRGHSLMLPVLLHISTLPCDSLQGSFSGPALDPLLLLEVLQLLLEVLAVQLAFHDVSKNEAKEAE